MAKRASRYTPEPYDTAVGKGDPFLTFYGSMLNSEAFCDLTKNQRLLLFYCRYVRFGVPAKKKPYQDDESAFYFNRALWKDTFKLYSEANKQSFYTDMLALISHGFIDCEMSGKTLRAKSIYRYSSRWKKYGTPEFEVPASVLPFTKEK